MLDADGLAAALRTQLARLDVVGAGLGVRLGDEAVATGAGCADIRDPAGPAVDGEALFQIGSISKTFTATLVVILAERGLLSLDERVVVYLPNFELADAGVTDAVTVRHLLQHTGGWEGDHTLALGAVAGGAGRGAMARNVASLKGADVFGAPGRFFSYNNGAFESCGALVEAVCPGRLFEEVLYAEVLAPLGLHQTFMYSNADAEGESHIYCPEAPSTPGRRAVVGHTRGRAEGGAGQQPQWVYAEPWYDPMGRGGYGDGGIVCSAADLVKYGSYWLSDDPAPLALSADVKRAMLTPAVQTETFASIGLSWYIENPWADRGGSATTAEQRCRMISHVSALA